MCVKLHTVSKITLCGKLHTVCKFTHCESNYTLWVKWHTVCKMTHSLWHNTLCKKVLSGVLFALIVKKIPLSQFFYTSTAIDASDKYQVCQWPCLWSIMPVATIISADPGRKDNKYATADYMQCTIITSLFCQTGEAKQINHPKSTNLSWHHTFEVSM